MLRDAQTLYAFDPPRSPKRLTSPNPHIHLCRHHHHRSPTRHPPLPAPHRHPRCLPHHRTYIFQCFKQIRESDHPVYDLITIVIQIRPTSSSFGKSRPLPKIPKSPPPPLDATFGHSSLPLPSPSPPPRPRSPPPAWSPPQTVPVSRRSPSPTSSSARPLRPHVVLPPTPPQRPSSATPTPRFRVYSTLIDDGSVTALPPAPLRVRPLPMRPPPPGPPGEGDTPVAQFGRVRWISESSMISEEEDDSGLCDDRRAIDWDLIDEIMTHAN